MSADFVEQFRGAIADKLNAFNQNVIDDYPSRSESVNSVEQNLQKFPDIVNVSDEVLLCVVCNDVTTSNKILSSSNQNVAQFSIQEPLCMVSSGLAVGHVWLNGAQEEDGFLQSERTLSLLSLTTNIGDMGHGRETAKKFVNAAYEEAKLCAKSMLGKERLSTGRLSIVTKMTVIRQTLLLTGVITFYNGN